jgi:hypothetical protein
VNKLKSSRPHAAASATEGLSNADWSLISATYLDGIRSASECRKRWGFLSKNEGQKHLWSLQESALLQKSVKNFLHAGKPHSWKQICDTYNSRVPKGKPIRSARQCREHWTNKLDPALDKSKFSLAEEIQILKLYKKHGRSSWHKIAADLNI